MSKEEIRIMEVEHQLLAQAELIAKLMLKIEQLEKEPSIVLRKVQVLLPLFDPSLILHLKTLKIFCRC
jgi:hypothetical protein